MNDCIGDHPRVYLRHQEEMRASGLTDETVRLAGIRSLDRKRQADEITKILGWDRRYEGRYGDCWVIPYRNRDGTPGGHHRLKFDNPRGTRDKVTGEVKTAKYEAPRGVPNRAYFPPRTIPVLDDPSVPLIITEGEKKALKADQEGFRTLGLSGVWTWQRKRQKNKDGLPAGPRELIPDLEAIPWEGRQVYVVFDSDAATNESVQKAENHLAQVLAARGAVVKVIRLPPGPPDKDGKPAKVGIDDYFVARHTADDFRRLLGSAGDPEPSVIVEGAAPIRAAETSAERPWPTIDPAAFHGLLGEFVRVVEPHTEADPAGILVQGLVAFGNLIGRTAHFRAEADTHYLNEFAVLVGPSSKGRKGSSWGHVKRWAAAVDEEWATGRVQSGLSSGEGVIWSVRDPIVTRQKVRKGGRVSGSQEVETDPGVSDKRLLAYEPEFASLLKVMERQGSTLSPLLRQFWDGAALVQTITKNSPAKATGAHISLIGHCTCEELRRYLSTTEAANGFGNRHMFVCVRRARSLPEGGNLNLDEVEAFHERFARAAAAARTAGMMRRDEDARAVWRDVYDALAEGRPGQAGCLLNRGEAHVMRLACLYATLDCSALIRAKHLVAALALWQYVEQSVYYVFGDSTGDPVADDILRLLRNAGAQGATRTEISGFLGRHQNKDRIGRALGLLLEHRRAHFLRETTAGKPAERWFAAKRT
jgi:hypothetical protein